MFSEMLQGLLNSSGQAKAMQRYTQMNNYVNGLSGQVAQQKNNINNLLKKRKILYLISWFLAKRFYHRLNFV